MDKNHKQITVVFKKTELEKLQKAADDGDYSLSAFIRKIARQFLETFKGETK